MSSENEAYILAVQAMEKTFGRGAEVAHTVLRSNAEAKRIYDCALVALVDMQKASDPAPIRDAPKDGTPILLWTNGRWIEGRWDEDAHDPWSDADDGYWKLRYAEVDFYSVTPERQPTHWVPVPADPTKETAR